MSGLHADIQLQRDNDAQIGVIWKSPRSPNRGDVESQATHTTSLPAHTGTPSADPVADPAELSTFDQGFSLG